MSLGIDIIPFKVCSFDCIYCQLGRTTQKTIHRGSLVDTYEVISELKKALPGVTANYITFSGSGEPTLNSDLGLFIKEAKESSSIPVAVLTNGSLLGDPSVQEALSRADLVIPSVDAATQEVFEKINRPFQGLKMDVILDGLRAFSEGFHGRLWIEVMLVRGVNDSKDELGAIGSALSNIKAEKIQLNTVERPPAESFARPLSENEMERAKSYFDERVEIITTFVDRHVMDGRYSYGGSETLTTDQSILLQERRKAVLELLRRRPCTARDVADALGFNINEASKYLGILSEKKLIESVRTATGATYFRETTGR